MNKHELKPCPCCGGKAELGYHDPYDGYQGNLGRYFVTCTACGLETPRTFKRKAEAVEVWNRRVEEYKDGDIYLNPAFGDMWIVDGNEFIKINDGLRVDLDEPVGFIKVGHVDGVIAKKFETFTGEAAARMIYNLTHDDRVDEIGDIVLSEDEPF